MTDRRTRRRRARRLTIFLASILGAGILLLVLSYGPSFYAKNAMLEGQNAFARGQEQLLAGDVDGARTDFVIARAAFEDAEGAASHPALRVLSAVPLFGRTPTAIRSLAQVGVDVATAGVAVSDGLAHLPDGLASLSPRNGRIPLDAIESLQEPVADANAAIRRAAATARTIPQIGVLAPVSAAARELRDRLAQAEDLAGAADALFTSLPDFAGADGPRRYFVAGQNPAESRGTGGFVGVYSILTLDDGKIELERFRDITTLRPPRSVEPAPEGLASTYGGDIATSMASTNLVPDAPTAAELMTQIWGRSHRSELDGVVFVDPQALAALLEATGPVRAPELNETLSAENAVAYLTNDAYFRFEGAPGTERTRKEALGIAAERIWNRFLAAAKPQEAIAALSKATSDGHILLYSTDPDVQASFEEADVAGAFRDPGHDFFGSVTNNAAANKVDFYMQRRIDYEVQLRPDGSAEASAMVTMTNTAPRDAQPGWAMGPWGLLAPGVPRLQAGDDLVLVGTYCSADCVPLDATRDDGLPLSMSEHQENGLTLLSSTLLVRPKETRSLTYRLLNPHAWEPTSVGGTYHLRIEAQQTVEPVQADVRIRIPDGMEVADTTPQMELRADTLVWQGAIGSGVDLSVAFQQPMPQRGLTRLSDFLRRPVLDL